MTHKYGVEVPTSIELAYRNNTVNGSHLWCSAINRKIENLKVAFDILHKGQTPPQGYTKASGHLVFDVRMTLDGYLRGQMD